MESSDKDIKTAADDCSKQFGVSFLNMIPKIIFGKFYNYYLQKVNTDPLYKCMNSIMGNSLQHENAYKTEQLNPAHTYVKEISKIYK